jgi:hypothetical protein
MDVILEKIGEGVYWLARKIGIPDMGQFFGTLVQTGKYVGLLIAMVGFLLMMPRLSFSSKLIKIGITLIVIFGGIEIAFY